MMQDGSFALVIYLDDFLLIADTADRCMDAQLNLTSLLQSLGFEVKWEKVTNPAQRARFLGLIIDSVKQRIELPIDKLQKLSTLAATYAQRKSITKLELQSIVGYMASTAKAIYAARTFS